MCQPSLRAILPSFASAQDRFTLLRDQASSTCLVEPKQALISSSTAQTKIPPRGWYCLFGGAGGNRTRVRKSSTDSSTYLALLFSLICTTPTDKRCTDELP